MSLPPAYILGLGGVDSGPHGTNHNADDVICLHAVETAESSVSRSSNII